MKLLVPSILVVLHLFGFNSTYAQEVPIKRNHEIKSTRNSISLTAGDYYIRNTDHEQGPFVQLGITYDRLIGQHFGIGIGYSEWNTLWKGNRPFDGYDENTKIILQESDTREDDPDYQPTIDQIIVRFKYKMADLYIYYQNSILGNCHHDIRLALGPSYNWGVNSKLATYRIVPYFPYEEHKTYKLEDVYYFGFVFKANYTYAFCKGIFGVGVGYNVRTYLDRDKLQHDLYFQTTLNF